MKAIVQDGYGAPERRLVLSEVDKPVIGDDQVLVRVHATSVNAADDHALLGRPYFARLAMGFPKPKSASVCSDVSGVVEAVGAAVTQLRPGDEVFGSCRGAAAEFVAGRERNIVPKPPNLSFEQAATLPIAGVTALQALRDHGHVQRGQRVLIIGAGGGVGSFAVQLAARAFGADVTATTSERHTEVVRSMGANEVVDYTREDVTRGRRRFDLVLDVGGYAGLAGLARILVPGGTAVLVGAGKGSAVGLGARLLEARLRSRVGRRRMVFFLATITRDDLLTLGELAAAGTLTPVVDRAFPLAETAAAFRHFETGKPGGKVVITVQS